MKSWLAVTAIPDFAALRQQLAKREYIKFLDNFDDAFTATEDSDKPLMRALAGEGLVQCLCAEPLPAPTLTAKFFQLLADGKVDLPSNFPAQVAERFNLPMASPLESMPSSEKKTRMTHNAELRKESSGKTIIRTKRVVQVTDYQWGTYSVSDALGLRQSVFRSQQEKCFLRALSLRFPGLTALPNYPLDQIADLGKLQSVLDAETIKFGRRCRIDALLVIPDEGDPVAAFELDSSFHDSVEAKRRDQLKDRLLQVVGVPLFRLRAKESLTMDTDEWYTLLTEEIVDQVSCGDRIRSRRIYSSLVPVSG